MGAPPAIPTRREIRGNALDLTAFCDWLNAAIARAVRVPDAHLQALCDAVVAMVQSCVGETERVAVEVERDGGCLSLRVQGFLGEVPAREDVLLWSA